MPDADGTAVARASRTQGPGEVRASPTRSGRLVYDYLGKIDALARPHFLPNRYLAGVRPEAAVLPDAPLIVFINARSGGRSGPELTLALSRALGRVQVFDLSHFQPDQVLTQIWDNFKSAIAAGVPHAEEYQRRLRLLVAGGDGTIAWVLAIIKTLKLHPQPPVAIMPLGTGNDLSRSFGWGPAFDKSWIRGYSGVYHTLQRIQLAKPEDLDCWRLRISFPKPELCAKLPHSLKAVREPPPQTPPTPPAAAGGGGAGDAPLTRPPAALATGLFWNYVSVGLDARAAYNFHHLRETQPSFASNRLANQFWYSFFSCTSGWFCCTKSLGSKVRLEVQRPGSDDWTSVRIPRSVKAIVILNLQSYAGGRNLWGLHKPGRDDGGEAPARGGFREPSYSDGLLEVVGLTSGWHTAAVMGTKGALVHAKRLTQASGVRLQLQARFVRPDGQPSHAYLQVDGEPWIQDVPSGKDDLPILVEISNAGVSKVLHNHHGLGAVRPEAAAVAVTQLPGVQLAEQGPAPAVIPALRGPTHVFAAHASTAGTAMDSEAVQVGSEQASSVRSGTSWAVAHPRADVAALQTPRPGSSAGPPTPRTNGEHP